MRTNCQLRNIAHRFDVFVFFFLPPKNVVHHLSSTDTVHHTFPLLPCRMRILVVNLFFSSFFYLSSLGASFHILPLLPFLCSPPVPTPCHLPWTSSQKLPAFFFFHRFLTSVSTPFIFHMCLFHCLCLCLSASRCIFKGKNNFPNGSSFLSENINAVIIKIFQIYIYIMYVKEYK